MPDPRLFLEIDLAPGGRALLEEGPSRYLRTVLRLEAGAGVRVFNGRDGECAATLETEGRRGAALRIGPLLRPFAPAPDLTLLFAPLKRQTTDWLVEKATELGARTLQPVLTRRTNAETVRLERLTAIVREAAEQTERLDLPDVRAPLPLAKALEEWPPGRALFYADEEEAANSAPALKAMQAERAGAVALLVGPEGGFDPEERRWLRGVGFVRPISLGPRILRAETAALAGLTLVQAAWGDWRTPDA